MEDNEELEDDILDEEVDDLDDQPEYGTTDQVLDEPINQEQQRKINNRQKVDNLIDGKASQAIQGTGVPKPIADAAVKTNGGPLNLAANGPGSKMISNFSRNQLAKGPMFNNQDDGNKIQQVLNKKNQFPLKGQNQQEQTQEENQGIGEKLDKVGEKAVSEFGGKAITAATGGAVSGPAADAIAKTVAKPAGKLLKYGIFTTLLPILFFLLFICIPIFTAVSMDDSGSSDNDQEQQPQNYCSGTTVTSSELVGKTQKQCVEILGPIAQADYVNTGVLASVTLGQMLEESGCGTGLFSETAKNANNLFGIKYFNSGTGSNGWDGKSYYTTSGGTKYKKFAAVNDAIENHSSILKNYKNLINETTYEGQLTNMQSRGGMSYCCNGDKSYVTRISSLITKFNLTQWDVKSNSVNSSVCSSATTGNADWKIRTIAPTRNDSAFNLLKKQNVGQCVWYAQGRAIEILQELMKNGKMSESNGNEAIKRLGSIFGNAEAWYRKSIGLFKGSADYKKVKSGSIISWTGGSTMCSPRCGHVAVVESVTEKEVVITEGWSSIGNSCPTNWGCISFRSQTMSLSEFYNWVPTEGTLGARTGKKFSGYIYFLELEQ